MVLKVSFKKTAFGLLWTTTQRFFHNFITRIHNWHKNARKNNICDIRVKKTFDTWPYQNRNLELVSFQSHTARGLNLVFPVGFHIETMLCGLRIQTQPNGDCLMHVTCCGLKLIHRIGGIEWWVVVGPKDVSTSTVNSSFSLKAIYSNKSWPGMISQGCWSLMWLKSGCIMFF